MQSFDHKPMDEWNDHDRLVFALAGLTRVSAEALKDAVTPPHGWVDHYPDQLVDQLDYWLDKVRDISKPEKEPD